LIKRDMKKGDDVAVIGASAAGLYSAGLLARTGRQVRVFDASPQIDPSPRTLIVTDSFRTLMGSLAEECVVNEIKHFQLFANGCAATVSLNRPDLVVERSIMIRNLAARAEAEGASIVCDHRFLDLEPKGPGLELTLATNSHTVSSSAGVVIGAEGAFSAVARSAGFEDVKKAPLIQAVVDLPADLPPSITRVWFLPEETPYFYWLVPFSETRGVLGLIGEDEGRTRRLLEGFLEKRGFSGVEFQDGLTPVYNGWLRNHRKMGNGDVYLVGDAAGHVKVTTVGGIVTGFRGAQGVVEAIVKGRPGRLLRKLRAELNRHLLIRKFLHRFSQDDYARALDLLNPGTRKSLGTITRDETGQLLLRIALKQPSFLLLGLRSLLLGR
jgi:digeranylgeranylglycerophospholipid reductase